MSRSPATTGCEYPSPFLNSQSNVGPPDGKRLSKCVSEENALCMGPRKHGKSEVTASFASGFGAAWNVAFAFASTGVAAPEASKPFGGAGSVNVVCCADAHAAKKAKVRARGKLLFIRHFVASAPLFIECRSLSILEDAKLLL